MITPISVCGYWVGVFNRRSVIIRCDQKYLLLQRRKVYGNITNIIGNNVEYQIYYFTKIIYISVKY